MCPRPARAALLALLLVAGIAPAATPADAFLDAVRRREERAWRPLLDADTARARDAVGTTALHLAALNHDLAAVTALLAAGSAVDAANAAGATPLLYGAGDAAIVRTLLAAGANPNATSAIGTTPLHAAAAVPGNLAAVEQLVSAGAKVTAPPKGDADPLLSIAILSGDRAIGLHLLERGAEVNRTRGLTPLAAAAFIGDLPTARALLDRGAALNQDAGFAGHALNWALYAGHAPLARELIERGSDLTFRSPAGHGTPPMVWSAYNDTGDDRIARLLTERGLDPNTANDDGVTALDFARRVGDPTALTRFLEQAGARTPPRVSDKRVPAHPVPAPGPERAALVRQRAAAALSLLQHSSRVFLDNAFVKRSQCISCHGQDLPGVAVERARARGLVIDEAEVDQRLAAHEAMWRPTAERARQMRSPLPDVAVSAGYGFYSLKETRFAKDEMTDALARYLLRTQLPDGSWPAFDRRPPMEDGPVVATAWAALGVRDYSPIGYEREAAVSRTRSAAWLASREPVNQNERVFRLLGLHWSGVSAREVRRHAEPLLREQREDGGWGQLPGLPSDAWATGLALLALHEGAGLPVTDPVYERGVTFLLRTQFEDGSWWVRTRTWPFQPHFNGQFPHGKDQWISQGGTAWAVLALLATLEPLPAVPEPRAAQARIAAYAHKAATVAPLPASPPGDAPHTERGPAVDFSRDVAPLFERSCAGCHGGDKRRGDFSLATREGLLKGGASGEPAILPGAADRSPLLDYVLGRIEDLEMPPLNRRDVHPPLTPAEISTLRRWIDAGAPWPSATPSPP